MESDQWQPIRIQADSAEIIEERGLSIYKGDVSIVQGSLQINAETVEIKSEDRKILEVLALSNTGSEKLARFRQTLSNDGEEIFAEAKK